MMEHEYNMNRYFLKWKDQVKDKNTLTVVIWRFRDKNSLTASLKKVEVS
jgi:hypothetical protein